MHTVRRWTSQESSGRCKFANHEQFRIENAINHKIDILEAASAIAQRHIVVPGHLKGNVHFAKMYHVLHEKIIYTSIHVHLMYSTCTGKFYSESCSELKVHVHVEYICTWFTFDETSTYLLC